MCSLSFMTRRKTNHEELLTTNSTEDAEAQSKERLRLLTFTLLFMFVL
jgi:hypothetical protein